MSGFAAGILRNERLVGAAAVLLLLSGVLAFLGMTRQEDPYFPHRVGRVIAELPGADPERIARLLIPHLEREISQVEFVETVSATARPGVAVVLIHLQDWVYDTQSAWERVRQALERAARLLPAEATRPALDDQLIATSTATLAVVGSEDVLVLAAAARALRDRVLSLPSVQRTSLVGSPGEQVTVALEDARAMAVGLTTEDLAARIREHSAIRSGGALTADGLTIMMRPDGEFQSLDEIRALPILLPGGVRLPLGALADIRLTPTEPPTQQFWTGGSRAVGVDVVTVPNRTHQIRFGARLRAEVEALRATWKEDGHEAFAGLEIREIFFQPDRVERRLASLGASLLYSIAIIVIVLFAFLGVRLGLVVTLILPLATAATLTAYAIGGEALHQIAVIGIIVALGILVDNAIVVVEHVQWRLDAGDTGDEAALHAIRDLTGPLGAATGTTVAAFVPMLLSQGPTGDFTRAIPVTVITALIASYAIAMTVTPVVAKRFLRPRTGAGPDGTPAAQEAWADAGRAMASWATGRPGIALAACLVPVVLALAWGTQLDTQFFPQAARHQLVLDLTLQEGTRLHHTAAVAEALTGTLEGLPGVRLVHTFIGTTGPRFYYNLPQLARQPGRARLVVVTDGLPYHDGILAASRQYVRTHLPDAELVPRRLAQGPPVDAPVEIRVFHPDAEPLAEATFRVQAWVQAARGTIDVRHDLGSGMPSIRFDVREATVQAYGLRSGAVAEALQRRADGVEVGWYFGGDEPAPIKIRAIRGELQPAHRLDAISLPSPSAGRVPIGMLVDRHVEWMPAAVSRRSGRRVARVSAELAPGASFASVLGHLERTRADLELPVGTKLEVAGEAEASGEANHALLVTMPLGVGLLLSFLLLQFNSFRRLTIVLLTVPLAAAGIVPGLALSGWPFGYMPLFGIIALVGIVVNNGIVLIDLVDRLIDEGSSRDAAIVGSVARRTRPIVMTTATTIAGLLPLTFSGSSLWPPMAWSIISGLAVATPLSLIFVPAMCRLWLPEPNSK